MGGFLSHEGGGVRGGLTFVTKKVFFLNEGFPYKTQKIIGTWLGFGLWNFCLCLVLKLGLWLRLSVNLNRILNFDDKEKSKTTFSVKSSDICKETSYNDHDQSIVTVHSYLSE